MTADAPRPAGAAWRWHREPGTDDEWAQVWTCCGGPYGERPVGHYADCPRPIAASGGATDGEREDAVHRSWCIGSDCDWPEQHEHTAEELAAHTTAVSQADDGLRAVAELLWADLINEDDLGAVEKLLPILADAAALQRVRKAIQAQPRHLTETELHRALNGVPAPGRAVGDPS